MSVLEVTDLTVSFAGDPGEVRAVRGLTLSLAAGTILGWWGSPGLVSRRRRWP